MVELKTGIIVVTLILSSGLAYERRRSHVGQREKNRLVILNEVC
jgi:hypothetical protein